MDGVDNLSRHEAWPGPAGRCTLTGSEQCRAYVSAAGGGKKSMRHQPATSRTFHDRANVLAGGVRSTASRDDVLRVHQIKISFQGLNGLIN